ncbi:MAG: hypothetical protein VX341_09760 [Bdellovibrionota bacterium]|nr:hypothetical protein [Bdellovibrionota bacterium]
MKYLFLILSFACLIKINTFARKPAVEPIMGVSIEEYKEVPPAKAKGYDFSRKPNSNVNNQDTIPTKEVRIHNQNEIKSQSQTKLEDTSNKNFLFFVLVALPLLASFVSYLRFKSKDTTNANHNVIDLNSKRSSTHNDDDDVKRAS